MSVKNLTNKSLSVGIVGAGPAGAMLAYLLVQKGHKVHILERKQEVERRVCGEYLCPKAVELLKEMLLFHSLCLDFLSLNGMVLVSPDHQVIPTYFPFTTQKHYGLSINRKIFDQNILKLAVEHGVHLLTGRTVTNAFQNPNDKWTITTEKETFTFDLLVAADGRQSKIGSLLGHNKSTNTERVALHCYLPRKTDRGNRQGEMHILGNGDYCGLNPVTDDEVNFSIVCNSQKLKKSKPREIINNTITNSKRLSSMFDLIEDPNDIKIVTSLQNQNNFIAGNNLAYVGDAAGFIDPLTGEGIYNAILSSYLLAESLETNEDLNQALQVYKNKKRKLFFQKNILNHFFQYLIKSPKLIKMMVLFLKKYPKKANHFIGIVGNIHSPVTGLIKMLQN